MRKNVQPHLLALSILWACRTNMIVHQFQVFGWCEHCIFGFARALAYFLLFVLPIKQHDIGVYALLSTLQATCAPLILFRLQPYLHVIGGVVLVNAAVTRRPMCIALHALLMLSCMRWHDICWICIIAHLNTSLVLCAAVSVTSYTHYLLEIFCACALFVS